jgi:hypothetical protein
MTVDQLRDNFERLNETEQLIITTQVQRMIDGRDEYGPWDNQKKNNPKEALEELLDGMQYISAELIKIG